MKRVIGGLFLSLLSVMWIDGAVNPAPTDNPLLFAFLGTAAAIGCIYCFVRQLSIWKPGRNGDNRFYGALASAAWERLGAYRMYKTHEAVRTGELEVDGWSAIPLEELLPWEDADFRYQYIGVAEHNDAFITTHYGVFLKVFGAHMLIEETYDCENIRKRYTFWTADQAYQKGFPAFATSYQ